MCERSKLSRWWESNILKWLWENRGWHTFAVGSNRRINLLGYLVSSILHYVLDNEYRPTKPIGGPTQLFNSVKILLGKNLHLQGLM